MKRFFILCLAAMAMACSTRPALIPRTAFQGEVEGVPIDLYTLKSENMTVQVTNFGARVVSMYTQDKHGNWADIVVGHNNLQAYVTPPGERFLGATVGPVANRIGNATYQVEGETWHTDANDNGVNTLHGGFKGIDMRPWTVKSSTPSSLTLSLECSNGQDGFPGNRTITLTYSVSGPDFKVEIEANSNKITPFNITHHPFFCLRGEGEGTVEDYVMSILASAYTPVDSLSIPTGEIAPVEGTPFDFRTAHPIGAFIGEENQQLRFGRGYDHNWCLDGEGMRSVCKVQDPVSGRTVEVITDQPGLQFYSGNFFDGSEPGKNGKPLIFRSSLALEAQGWPDAVNHPEFPSIIVKPEETYSSTTIYRFGVKWQD
ncbi:MAG: galactose mutarotase [Bacteroidales bacterium]|nr:galactose mutarotase [Bacteroidales bacterium]